MPTALSTAFLQAQGTPIGATTRQNLPGKSISEDGRYLIYIQRDTNGIDNLLLFDRVTNAVETLTVPRVAAASPRPASGIGSFSISADGSIVGFVSSLPDLAPGITDGLRHAYVLNRNTGTLHTIDQTPAFPTGSQPISLAVSPNGRFVGYSTQSSVYLVDRTTGTHSLVLALYTQGSVRHVTDSGRHLSLVRTPEPEEVARVDTQTSQLTICGNTRQSLAEMNANGSLFIASAAYGELRFCDGTGSITTQAITGFRPYGAGSLILSPSGRYLTATELSEVDNVSIEVRVRDLSNNGEILARTPGSSGRLTAAGLFVDREIPGSEYVVPGWGTFLRSGTAFSPLVLPGV